MKKQKIPDGCVLQQRAIKVRIYPNKEQVSLLQQTFGCCRFIWNQMLDFEQEIYAATDQHFIATPAKFKKQYPFLKEVDSLALANVQLQLQKAFKAFFKSDSKHPKFKSKKKDKKSYTTNCQGAGSQATVKVYKHYIQLPKLGYVAANVYRKPMQGWKLKSATVSQSASGKYFCSLLYEYVVPVPEPAVPTESTTLGLDYSSPHFYVDSHGDSPEGLRWFRRSEAKLAKLQRQLSRMTYDSKNYNATRQKVNLMHERIANQRKDFAHKQSAAIAKQYDAVCVEDIDLRGLSASLNFGKATTDNGFGMFRNFLRYKLESKGGHFIVIDKWYPSSKTCHICGTIYDGLQLGEPDWRCEGCGTLLNRDHNAAINIKQKGLMDFYVETHPQSA